MQVSKSAGKIWSVKATCTLHDILISVFQQLSYRQQVQCSTHPAAHPAALIAPLALLHPSLPLLGHHWSTQGLRMPTCKGSSCLQLQHSNIFEPTKVCPDWRALLWPTWSNTNTSVSHPHSEASQAMMSSSA